ncbi:hypothetical protein EVAR_10610_1 [Eumeta japonica]|uniref:Uncharacterized protein n=1 Tax=Eumeta variegata TaxID=151549 RepID=A0A4C1U1W5_EUMVA|nr:hypothetical protein EVAR_10610_1 [Eumeta japonica]
MRGMGKKLKLTINIKPPTLAQLAANTVIIDAMAISRIKAKGTKRQRKTYTACGNDFSLALAERDTSALTRLKGALIRGLLNMLKAGWSIHSGFVYSEPPPIAESQSQAGRGQIETRDRGRECV